MTVIVGVAIQDRYHPLIVMDHMATPVSRIGNSLAQEALAIRAR
jgi:hypothetical protein